MPADAAPNDAALYRDEEDMQVARAELALALRRAGFANRDILSAIERTPRHVFVSWKLRDAARQDIILPIECGQFLPSLSSVTRYLHLADIKAGQRVLEIGTGSGYQAAVLSAIGVSLVSVERYQTLFSSAQIRLAALGCAGTTLSTGNGLEGVSAKAPFDRILINGALSEVPTALFMQLANDGILLFGHHNQNGPASITRMKKIGEVQESQTVGLEMMSAIINRPACYM